MNNLLGYHVFYNYLLLKDKAQLLLGRTISTFMAIISRYTQSPKTGIPNNNKNTWEQ
jgi:hypothetical protein